MQQLTGFTAEKIMEDLKGVVFETSGRLFDRPIKELVDALKPHGIVLTKDPETRTIRMTGEMTPGDYQIDVSVTSQSLSGLLLALSIFDEPSRIEAVGELNSVHYLELTLNALEKYGNPVRVEGVYYYPSFGGFSASIEKDKLPEFKVEGDWSNGAFLLCMSRWSDIKVHNLSMDSGQGDREIVDYLKRILYINLFLLDH